MDDFQQEVQDIDDVSDSPAESVEVESQEAETEAPEQMTPYDEGQQAKFNSVIGEKVAKTHEVTRERDDLQKQLDDLKASQPQPTVPEVPPLPDQEMIYDDPEGYTSKLVERDQAIKQRAEYDAQSVLIENQQAANAQRLAQEKQAEFKVIEDNYAKNGESFGIDESKLLTDAQTVLNSGVSGDMIVHIAKDAQGALIMKHLNDNPLELDAFRNLQPFQQAQYIESTVRPKLTGARKATKAPKPAEVLGGAGVPEKVDRLTQGAVYSS